jgi:hypothetical protein
MSLWVKRTGQLLLAALFLMACEDENSLLGFRNPISKFDVKFIEIPLESSVYLIDSVRTSNFAGETNRLLVGEHTDSRFGQAKTTGFTQVIPRSSATLDVSAQIDSVVLHLRLDYYTYGDGGTSVQSFQVHELTEQLYFDSADYYYSSRSAAYDPNPLGSASLLVDQGLFKTQFEKSNSEKDTTLFRVVLSNAYGNQLLARAKSGDSTYTRFSEFSKYIKGLAIVPVTNDKVIGFDINNTLDAGSSFSKIIVHYHTNEKDSLELNFGFGGAQFTKIETDRSGSDVDQLANFYEEIQPVNNLRYSQIGTGIITKVDFSNFIDFSNDFPNFIINSAELVIADLESVDSYTPINSFSLQVIYDNNRLRKIKRDKVPILRDNKDDPKKKDTIGYNYPITAADQEIINRYFGFVNNFNEFFTVISDINTTFTLAKSSTTNSYGGNLTRFAQQLYTVDKNNKEPFRHFALYPTSPQMGKGLNRVIFNKDNLKLRVYYTVPTLNQ